MEVVIDYIRGFEYLRSEVEGIYEKCLESKVSRSTPNWYTCFMSEEFNEVCPDFVLKIFVKGKYLKMYRKEFNTLMHDFADYIGELDYVEHSIYELVDKLKKAELTKWQKKCVLEETEGYITKRELK